MRLVADENFPKSIVEALRDESLFRSHPATPEMLSPLVRAFVEANAVWAGHISIISAEGIQMVAARKQ